MLQYLRSLLYIIQVYFAMLVVGLLWLPWALVSRRGARHCCKSWVAWARWTASWMVGMRCEVRGAPPEGDVLIAAKHQSFLDAMLIFSALPRGYFIMKHSLIYAPIVGLYGLRVGCIPIKRGQRARAIKKMKQDVAEGRADGGQLIIYPQGSRIAPGAKAPYKVGASVLYEQLGQPVVPVACNVGLFWPRKGILRHPGLAVVEFLEPIPPGLPPAELTARLEAVIEPATARLEKEGGYEPD